MVDVFKKKKVVKEAKLMDEKCESRIMEREDRVMMWTLIEKTSLDLAGRGER